MKLSRQFSRIARPYVIIAIASTFFFVVGGERTDAHRPVTSKYDYNKDVFPLLREYCASCHVKGGPAPMSLMTYNDAVPWAESMRDELTAGRMPPWPIDPASPPVKGSNPINSRDIDILVTWASGGTPQGDLQMNLPPVTFNPQWKLGPPDLKIPMDVDHTVAPGTVEETCEFSLETKLTDTKWIRAADLMPGAASMVRDAVISVENGPVLAFWEPGGDTTAAPSGAAFRLAPGSRIHLQIHYKKHFDQELNAISDRSTVGLYYSEPPPSGRELQSFAIDISKGGGDANGSPAFAGTLPGAARIVALRPTLDRAYESLDVYAITTSGTHVPLLMLYGPRPQWFRRYWLQEPVELPSGSKIEVYVTPLSDYSQEPNPANRFPLEVALDYVSE